MHAVDDNAETRAGIGARLARAREDAGLRNKSAYARAIGVAPNTVYRYEKGEIMPDIWALESIARVTGVTIDWLVRGERTPDVASVLDAWTRTAIGRTASSRALAFLRSLPLGGYQPTLAFYDLALMAFERGLTDSDAAAAARATAAVLSSGGNGDASGG